MKILVQSLVSATALALAACGPADSHDPAPAAADAQPQQGVEGDLIRLTDEQIAVAEIGVAQAGPANLRDVLPLYGIVAPNAERVRDVSARFPGLLREVTGKVGDAVRQGATLATVESNESLQTYPVSAPLTGVVTARNANPGEQTGDRTLFTVADLSTVWVELALFPRDVTKVRIGQEVRVKSTDPGLAGTGKVIYLAPFGSSSNQTLTARVQLDNSHRTWAPGLYVNAELTLKERVVPLAIQSSALQTIDGNAVVFVQVPGGFAVRTVRIGSNDGEVTEVLDGLNPGESYAAINSYALKAEYLKREAADE